MKLAALAAIAGSLAVTSPPLHDARYCEVFEIRGAPPSATVTVWNTIGRGDCPAEQWSAFDPGALAQELGATAVILNGPRHFLMDSATAETGRKRDIGGLPFTEVASIPIRSSADLVQTTYTDRTIKRRNTWRWKRGRTVFELVAPGGDVYVMQSYAQIRDPALTIAGLPRLGGRLELPEGWRYRSLKLARDLVLAANGRATILQDDLLDTYQLAKATRPRGKRVRRRVNLTGKAGPLRIDAAGVEAHDTVSGAPFGRGSLVLKGTIEEGVLKGTFRMRFARGSVTGTVALPFTVSGDQIDVHGPATVTGGTGAYRGITGSGIQVRDLREGDTGTITVKGAATW